MQKKYIQAYNTSNLKHYTNTLFSMVNRNVRNQYRNSVLGIIWTVLNPLLNMVVLAVVFSILFNRNTMPVNDTLLFYPVYLLAGNTVFALMRAATSNSLPCIVNNYPLLSKTRLPHEIFPLSNLFSAVVNFFFSFIALVIIMLIFLAKPGVGFHWTLFMTLVPFLPSLMLFSLGVSFILATIYVRFRDISHIYGVVLTLWTYLTPLFYSLDMVQGHRKVTFVLKLNPMYYYVTYFRELIIGTVPSGFEHLMCYAWGVGMFAIGFLIFHKAKKKFLLHI